MALSAVAASAPTGGGALVCADAPPAPASVRMTPAKAEPAARRVFNALTTLISSRRLIGSTFPLRKSEVVVPWLVRDGSAPRATKANGVERSRERNFCPRGHRNPLKKLNSDKRIQANPSLFL